MQTEPWLLRQLHRPDSIAMTPYQLPEFINVCLLCMSSSVRGGGALDRLARMEEIEKITHIAYIHDTSQRLGRPVREFELSVTASTLSRDHSTLGTHRHSPATLIKLAQAPRHRRLTDIDAHLQQRQSS